MDCFIGLQKLFGIGELCPWNFDPILMGNGLVAIMSELFANTLACTLCFGPVSPFNAATCFLAIGIAIIFTMWTKNYGDPSESKDLLNQFKVASIAIS